MKTRSFSWKYLPNLHDEFDKCAKIYHGLEKLGSKKEEMHMKRLYEMSQVGDTLPYIPVSYSHAAMLAQILDDEDKIMEALKKTSHYEEGLRDLILERVKHAGKWAEKYAPPEYRIEIKESVDERIMKEMPENIKKALVEIGNELVSNKYNNEDEIMILFRSVANKHDISVRDLFEVFYRCVMGKERGPKASTLVLSAGVEKIGKILLKLETT
jgi:lysyl-tRNA synthetase class 1